MPNVTQLTEFSGSLDASDLFHVLDVSASHPQDRKLPFENLIASLVAVGLFPTKVAAATPTANDDDTEGFAVGWRWLDTTGPTLYLCTDASTGSAVWRVIEDWS